MSASFGVVGQLMVVKVVRLVILLALEPRRAEHAHCKTYLPSGASSSIRLRSACIRRFGRLTGSREHPSWPWWPLLQACQPRIRHVHLAI
jgi:hypothetical protein